MAVQQKDRAQAAGGLPLYLVGGIWLLSLGLMFLAAVSPAPDSWFYVALGAFIGCSIAWTALQLSSGRRVRWPIVLIAGLLLLIFGVSTVVCNVWSLPWPWSPHDHPTSQWTVAAYACAYLGASYLVELLREQVDTHPRLLWAGLGLFGGGAALTLGIGIAFLLGAVSGIVPLLTLIAVILCVIALAGIAPVEVKVALADSFLPAGQPPSSDLKAQSSDLLALGDSYMSGEGAKTFIQGTDEADGDTCRRSPSAYTVLGVGPETPFTHVSFLACSGARVVNVLPQPGTPHPCTPHEPGPCPQSGESATQVDQMAALTSQLPHYKPDLVILSLGGNDAGFAQLGEACVAPGDCSAEQNLFLGNLRLVQSDLLTAYRSIRAALPDTPVAVVPYPQPLYDATSCGSIALTVHERQFIRNS